MNGPVWSWIIPLINLGAIILGGFIGIGMLRAHFAIQSSKMDEFITEVKDFRLKLEAHERELIEIRALCRFRHEN